MVLEQVPLKYHFVISYLSKSKAIRFNLVTGPYSAKLNICSSIVYLCMYTCKSYYLKSDQKCVNILHYVVLQYSKN